METKQDRITSSLDEEAIVYTEYAEALIGVDSKGRATYDLEECINILVQRDGMDYEEATEYFWFNTEGAYFGELTPLFVEVY